MTHFEMVEKLREKAEVSYEEAKAALEEANWDLLDAMVLLEKSGRLPENDGTHEKVEVEFTTKREDKRAGQEDKRGGDSFRGTLSKFGRWLSRMITKGNLNLFDVYKNGDKVLSLPINVVILLLCFAFYFTIPLAIVGLFFGFRYSFSGPDLGKDNLNDVIGKASDIVDEIKRDIKGGEGDNSQDGEGDSNGEA